jgi:hypothetical protein
LQERQEVAEALLLKHAEQARRQRLRLGAGHFVDRALLVHVRAFDRLELEIARHIGVQQQLDQHARRHDQLRHKVDTVVARAAELVLWRIAGAAKLMDGVRQRATLHVQQQQQTFSQSCLRLSDADAPP